MKIHTAFTAFSVIILSACSNSPSDSDAKKSVESLLGGCRLLSIENFEKVNGIANNDGSHVLEVKYSIVAKTLPEVAKMAVDYSTKWSEISARLEKAEQADEAAQKDLGERRTRKGILGMTEWAAFKAETDKFETEVVVPGNKLARTIREERNSLNVAKEAIAQRFKQECPSMNERLQYLMYDNNHGIDNYTKDFTKNYHVKLMMVKTDNGWMSAN